MNSFDKSALLIGLHTVVGDGPYYSTIIAPEPILKL